MKKSKNLSLKELKIKSFQTSSKALNTETVRGGAGGSGYTDGACDESHGPHCTRYEVCFDPKDPVRTEAPYC